LNQEAAAIEEAVKHVLEDGYCTSEFKSDGTKVLTTKEMAEKVINEIESELVSDHILAAYS